MLEELPTAVRRPGYDLDAVRMGTVHLGPGAFFRAHGASFLDDLLHLDPAWAVSAVALRSKEVRDALLPQDGLYTLVERGAEARLRVLGPLRELLSSAAEPERVRSRLRDPAVRLVTLTVTEKGYALNAAGELDLADPGVAHDLAHPGAPRRSVAGWLAQALADRFADGVAPPVVLSCDNLSDNGGRLGRAVAGFARAGGDHGLAERIAGEVRFPRTMVDSITPATDDALRTETAAALGVADAWPVQREPFTQWVVEDALGLGAPDLAAVGVTLAPDVAPFEMAKLRLLNAAHSTLAYLGRLAGRETVAEAMREPRLAAFVERLMRGGGGADPAALPAGPARLRGRRARPLPKPGPGAPAGTDRRRRVQEDSRAPPGHGAGPADRGARPGGGGGGGGRVDALRRRAGPRRRARN